MSEDDGGSSGCKRKSRPGRASRRRNRKIQAIKEAEAALFSASAPAVDDEDANSKVLPADRHRSLPGVLERRRGYYYAASKVPKHAEIDADTAISLDHICPGDERLLTSQLGFIPGNAVNVAARVEDCPSLHLLKSIDKYSADASLSAPTVLRLYPLAIRDACPKRKFKSRQRGQIGAEDERGSNNNNNDASNSKKRESRDWALDGDDDESGIIEPFPTQYWLTDPRLRMLISALEISEDFNVKTMEAKLRSNPEYANSMERAHKSYGQERWSLLTDADRKAVAERRWDGALGAARGVAGISNPNGVKCLHAHAAHFLAGCEDNLVGKWTMREVERMLKEKIEKGGGKADS